MTYRTTLTPQDFATAITQLGFKYLETSCHATTYVRDCGRGAHGDLVSIEEPEVQVFVDLEVATDFRFTHVEMEALKITASR